jgi:(1->4)-alpha-D-glucan 1-alpha-D-glucosylmutase
LLAAMRLTSEPVEADPTELASTASLCYQPPALQNGERLWGFAIQLYGLRSRRNWGIGDFTDLARLMEITAAQGGSLVGVNPLHALFQDNPAHFSPYSPSHRCLLNILYLDVEALPELAGCEEAQRRIASADFQAELARLRQSELLDYPGVARCKLEILRLLFRRFLAGDQSGFRAWREQQGELLEDHARYEALQAHFRAECGAWGWPAWPEAYRDRHSPTVAAFAAEHAEDIAFHAWLQWHADRQLGEISALAARLGMPIGLYADLAIGANSGGSEVWHCPEVYAMGASAGAPPDELNLLGQDWGLPPFVPQHLHQADYRPFRNILRANMQHAGALRIDHVMGLMRLFWVPVGMPATEGAYVAYPFENLLGIVAQESQRNRCLVIGEDLGTVPEGFRERMAAAGVLSYHPLIFERTPDAQFRLPRDMPAQALATAATHDMPTLAGFWRGVDLEERARLNLFPSEGLRQRLVTERDWDRGRLLWALEREALLPPGVSKDPAQMPELSAATRAAIHAYLGRSASQVLAIQPEDLFGVAEQTNVPGTLDHQHPNWQRKLPVDLEDWENHADFRRGIAAVRAGR